ncbi:hypothetical protein MASR2M78_20460 [Treponema sp.]
MKQYFDTNGISFTYNKYKDFLLILDSKFIMENKEILLEMNNIRFEVREKYNSKR